MHSRREVVDAVLCVVRAGCAWRRLPAVLSPWQTVYWYFVRWGKQRVALGMLEVLRQRVRRVEGLWRRPQRGRHRLPEREGGRHRAGPRPPDGPGPVF
uniref:transposase n=1 Tax=Actinomadura sp. CA-154981 TaxID=3240037 RepID=UPI003F490B68